MKLEASHGATTNEPNGYDIEQALQTLDQPDSFVILGRAGQEYIQAVASVIEYRAAGEHFHCDVGESDRKNVVAAFLAYHDGNDEFKSIFAWQRGLRESAPGSPPSNRPRLISRMILLLLVLAIAFVARSLGWF